MGTLTRVALVACLVVAAGVSRPAASDYPLALDLDAKTKAGATTLSSVVSIRIEELIPAFRRTRVLDGFKHGGYPGFLKELRSAPALGTIHTEHRSVELRYAHEEQTERGRRLVLVADRPMFFLSGDAAKPRAGYELTMMELYIAADGGITGTMSGAARVRPTPDWSGGFLLDDFADALVQLQGRLPAAGK